MRNRIALNAIGYNALVKQRPTPTSALESLLAASGPLGLDWHEPAVCRSRTDLFFGKAGERPGARQRRETAAVALCAGCPVRELCHNAGRENAETGIWGGETDEQRALAGYPPRSCVVAVAMIVDAS